MVVGDEEGVQACCRDGVGCFDQGMVEVADEGQDVRADDVGVKDDILAFARVIDGE